MIAVTKISFYLENGVEADMSEVRAFAFRERALQAHKKAMRAAGNLADVSRLRADVCCWG